MSQNMDLSMFSKENKHILQETADNKQNVVQDQPDNIEKSVKRAGRPSLEDQKLVLSEKYSINLNHYESEYLKKLVKDTGIPVSTYLRRKLLEAKAFGN